MIMFNFCCGVVVLVMRRVLRECAAWYVGSSHAIGHSFAGVASWRRTSGKQLRGAPNPRPHPTSLSRGDPRSPLSLKGCGWGSVESSQRCADAMC